VADWSVRARRRWVPLAGRRRVSDPFAVLELQMSLSRLDAEIRAIRADDVGFARAHHLRAAMIAYDGLLAEACRLAEIAIEGVPRDAVSRLSAEAELQARGWTW
jgi:hypothetical protein